MAQQVDIAADGSWIYKDRRKGTVQHGRLTAAQRKDLAGIVADPELAAEAHTGARPGTCADGFVYTIRAGRLGLRHEQCGAAASRQPRTSQLLTLVTAATPM